MVNYLSMLEFKSLYLSIAKHTQGVPEVTSFSMVRMKLDI